MDKDWFPFFSILFWFTTKVAGLIMFLYGLVALGTILSASGWLGVFWNLLFAAALPTALGFVVLKTDILYELGTGAMNARRPARPG